MLGFGVSAATRSKEIHVLILRGTYDVADIRIRKILFHNDLYNFELENVTCTTSPQHGHNNPSHEGGVVQQSNLF
jgi:hypothetical protein